MSDFFPDMAQSFIQRLVQARAQAGAAFSPAADKAHRAGFHFDGAEQVLKQTRAGRGRQWIDGEQVQLLKFSSPSLTTSPTSASH